MNLLQTLQARARLWFCIQMGTASTFGGILGGRASPGAGLAIGAAGALYGLVCDRPPPPPEDSPLEGGQCAGVAYSVVIDWKVRWYDIIDGLDREIDSANAKTVIGPVGYCGFEPVGANGLNLVWNGQNGKQEVTIFADIPRYTNQVRDLQGVTATRPDGLPDSCGNQPPSYPPYIPGGNQSPSDPITWEDDDGNSYNDDIDFTFGFPIQLPDGSITMPIEVNFNIHPELNFNGDINLPDFTLSPNFGNPGLPSSGCQPASDDYADEEEPDGYDDPPSTNIPDPPANEPQVENRRILRGCMVNTSVIPPEIGQIHQDFNPDIRIPNLGYVNFLIKVGTVQGWSEDIPVKNVNAFIRCEWEGGAILVRGTPRPGVAWRITNIYTRQSFDPRFPPEPG